MVELRDNTTNLNRLIVQIVNFALQIVKFMVGAYRFITSIAFFIECPGKCIFYIVGGIGIEQP